MGKLPSGFDILAYEIHAHLNPEFLNDKIDVQGLDIAKLKRYQEMINTLIASQKKIERYELYFESFYPSTNVISKDEALLHHMHSYLEDIYLLSNAIEFLFGQLKSDLKQVAPNKDEVCNSLDACLDKIKPIFANAREDRRKHRHAIERYLDADLSRVGLINTLVQTGTALFQDRLKDGALEYMTGEADKSFENAKTERIKMAKKNREVSSELMDGLFLSIEDLIYQFLGIQPIIRDKLKNVKWTDD